METTTYQSFTEAEIEAICAIETDQDWHSQAQPRIAHADCPAGASVGTSRPCPPTPVHTSLTCWIRSSSYWPE